MSRSLVTTEKPRCVIDRNVLNKHTVGDMVDMGLSIFAPLCGRNRGAFVLDPPNGNTYGCTEFPANFAELAGVKTDVDINDANAMKEQFQGGNITAADAVDLIDVLTQLVYGSSADVDKDPYACNVGGLGILECGASTTLAGDDEPIRAATLAGVFVPAPWATGGKTLTLKKAKAFYTAEDFADMANIGLNTVQIPVPLVAFADGESSGVQDALGDMLKLVEEAGLQAILVLNDSDGGDEEAVGAAAKFASKHDSTVLAVTLPSMASEMVNAARDAAGPDMILFVKANGGDLLKLHAADENVYAALDMPHSTTIGDVASSTSVDDRMKLFYHEATSCIARSPIEYAACQKDMPVFVSNGFDLSIDDCVNEGTPSFKDYGQCGRFDETVDSGWWESHRASFAARQLFAYERGLGWSFAAWKLYGDDNEDTIGVIDTPAKLLSLRDVSAAGLMPSLKKSPAPHACLNPPEPDFLLGDDTASPTPGPHPDCGDGWWNSTIQNCTFWVPPPPAPTCPAPLTKQALGIAAVSGAAVALAIGAVVLKLRRRNGGYTTIV